MLFSKIRVPSGLLTTLAVLFCFAQCVWAGPAEDGVSLFKARRYKEALNAFDKALATNKNDPNTLYYYALTLQQTGDSARARSAHQRIVTAFPDSGAAVYSRQALGLPAAAVKTPAASSATAAKGEALPFDCPVTKFPSATISEATDEPALIWGWKKIIMKATTTPAKVMSYYEAQLSGNSKWKFRDRDPYQKSKVADPQGNVMWASLTYLNQQPSEWIKELHISAKSPESAGDCPTEIEITLHHDKHYQ